MNLNWKKRRRKKHPQRIVFIIYIFIYWWYLIFMGQPKYLLILFYGSFAFYIVVWVWKTALQMYHVKRPLPGFRNPRECPVKEHRYPTVHLNFLFNLTKDHFHFLNLCLIWRERIQSKFSFTVLIKNRNHFEVLFIQLSE